MDIYPERHEAPTIELTRQEFLRVMGADVSDAEVEAVLAGLGFAPTRSDASRGSADSPAAAWKCRQPSWRADVTREVDLIEEVARIYGVDKFPARLPAAKIPAARLEYAEADDRLREILIGLGYQEIIMIPIVDETSDALFRAESAIPARIANPLAEDASVMRSTGAVTMARILEWNLNHGQRNVRLFEFGKTYGWSGAQPVETRVVTLGATGLAREKGVSETERAYTFADLKGDLDQLGHIAGGLAWTAGGPDWLQGAHSGKISPRVSGAASRRSSDVRDNFRGAFPKNINCGRMRTSRSLNSSRCARVINPRALLFATNHFPAFRRLNGISLSCLPTEQHFPPSKMKFVLWASPKFLRLTPMIYFAGKICWKENLRCSFA